MVYITIQTVIIKNFFKISFIGAYNHRSICPRTGEAECYSMFIDYLDPLICDYHGVKDPSFKHPAPTFGDLSKLPFGDLDPAGM